MVSLMSGGEMPFELLHSEIVSLMFALEEESAKENQQCATEEESGDLKEFSLDSPNAATKLEAMGYRVGYAMVERIAKELPRLNTELDCMKFVCKEFWSSVFKKLVDNLRTNHQGVYVVQDNSFWLLANLGSGAQFVEFAPRYLAFSCGLVRGALGNLNIAAVVTASVDTLPAVKFTIQLQPKMG